MIGRILSALGLGPYAALALAIAVAGAVGYNLWENSTIRAETRALAEAEAAKRTIEAINDVSNAAEDARTRRRICVSAGGVWNFETNQCGGG